MCHHMHYLWRIFAATLYIRTLAESVIHGFNIIMYMYIWHCHWYDNTQLMKRDITASVYNTVIVILWIVQSAAVWCQWPESWVCLCVSSLSDVLLKLQSQQLNVKVYCHAMCMQLPSYTRLAKNRTILKKVVASTQYIRHQIAYVLMWR